MLFEQLYHEETIRARYAAVTAFEDQTCGWAYHGWDHVCAVTEMTASILQQLNLPEDYIQAAKIAALFHDIGADLGKKNHAQRSADIARTYLSAHRPLAHEETIYQAICQHSDGFETDEIMTLALILSDKLDITRPRVAKAGYQVSGMRQLQYITAIDLQITPAKVTVAFTAEEALDLAELNQFYFTKKVFRAVFAFANKLERQPELFLNDQFWEYPA